jgi:hypothetical protein
MPHIPQNRPETLAQALAALNDLAVPEHLQAVALRYLLEGQPSQPASKGPGVSKGAANTGDLREFLAQAAPKGAVSEIPALLYWARENDGLEKASEKDVLELYRRAGLRPPKDIVQSFRDLCSKKYMRLEVPEGERGFVRLARAGEDYVLHDLIATK